jgi:oligosaccharide amylase
MSTVYLPTAVVGNGRTLCTIGASGEVMSFFFPSIDHAQHIHECMLGVYASGYGYSWTFEPAWQRSQAYIKGTNILQTKLLNNQIGIELTLTDLVPPELPALVRRIELRRVGLNRVHILLCHYFEFWVEGHKWKNCVQAFPSDRLIMQWLRETWIAVGATPFHQFQCGKSDPGSLSNAKDDLYDGSLKRQTLEIGSVNFALGWELSVSEDAMSIVLTITAGRSKIEALNLTARLRRLPFEQLMSIVGRHWAKWLDKVHSHCEDEVLSRAYERAQLTLPLLFDEREGAPLAAPEFDPAFVASGGYGFCWLRDATQMMEVWLKQRRNKQLKSFIMWASKAQSEDGSWLQRYWLNGSLGPAWSTDDENLQWDQVASMVIFACKCYRKLGELFEDADERKSLSKLLSKMALSGARKLLQRINEDFSSGRVPVVGMDLWETFRGSFVYTNAVIYRALCEAAELAKLRRQTAKANELLTTATKLKESTLRRMVVDGHLVRGVSFDGHVDTAIDSSVLGAITPFEMLSLEDEGELKLAMRTVDVIIERASVSAGGKIGILRFVGDSYAGGMACTVSTLWVGMAMLRIGRQFIKNGDMAEAERWLSEAENFIASGASFTTPAGLHCELFKVDGYGYWAPAHAWASAWVIQAVDELQMLKSELEWKHS